jgi:hypothetical protein
MGQLGELTRLAAATRLARVATAAQLIPFRRMRDVEAAV